MFSCNTKLFLASALAFLSLAANEALAARAGDPCTQAGVTTLDSDGVNIIGCLKTSTTNAALVWKAFTNANPTGAPLCHTVKFTKSGGLVFAKSPGGTPINTVAAVGVYGSAGAALPDFPSFNKAANDFPFVGVRCLSPYVRTGCSLATDGKDTDVASIDNGCMTDDNEYSGLNGNNIEGFYLTCCM